MKSKNLNNYYGNLKTKSEKQRLLFHNINKSIDQYDKYEYVKIS
ncbi:DegQ family regulator [Bacillus safensis]|nr:DegQ family regulator [Bacillus safensis]